MFRAILRATRSTLSFTRCASEPAAKHAAKVPTPRAPVEAAPSRPVVSEKPPLETLTPGKFILLAEGEKSSVMVEGFSGDAASEFAITGKPSFFIRKPTLQVATALHNFEENKQKSNKGFLLTGLPGSGKSHVLNSLVYHFKRRGWLVLFVPDVVRFTDGSLDWTPDPVRPGFFKQPDSAAMTLQSMAMGNEALLRALPAAAISSDLSFLAAPPRGYFADEEADEAVMIEDPEEEMRETSQEDAGGDAPARRRGPPQQQQQQQASETSESLSDAEPASGPLLQPIVVPNVEPEAVRTAYDVLCSGAHRKHAAPYVFDALMAMASKQTDTPVLVAIDAVNKVYDISNYQDEKLERIPARKMSMCESLDKVIDSGVNNGFVVGAVSAKLPMSVRMPLRTLVKAGYEDVPVAGYSREEAKTVLDFYHSTGVVESRIVGDKLAKLVMMTGGSGRRLLELASMM